MCCILHQCNSDIQHSSTQCYFRSTIISCQALASPVDPVINLASNTPTCTGYRGMYLTFPSEHCVCGARAPDWLWKDGGGGEKKCVLSYWATNQLLYFLRPQHMACRQPGGRHSSLPESCLHPGRCWRLATESWISQATRWRTGLQILCWTRGRHRGGSTLSPSFHLSIQGYITMTANYITPPAARRHGWIMLPEC